MGQFKRVCINFPIDVEQELRVLHVETIAQTRKNISFSKFLSYVLRETLSEKKKQQWYASHNCITLKLNDTLK